MSIIAQASNTVGTVLNTTNVLLNSVARGVQSAASGLDMLDTFVNDAKKRQLVDSKYAMKDYASVARLRHQTEAARLRTMIKQELSSNPDLKTEFDKLDADFDALETEIEAELKAL